MSASQSVGQEFVQYLILGLEQGSIYALIALGYTLVYGVLQLINFAHSEVFMAGGFGSLLVVNQLTKSGHTSGLDAVLVMIVGGLTGAVCGAAVAFALEKVAYKTLRRSRAPKLAFLISAIGASLFLSNLAGKLFNHIQNNQINNFFNEDKALFSIAGAKVQLLQAIIIVVALVTMVFLDTLVNRTKLGRSVRAVAEDAPTAALMGIDIDKTISRTFVIGGALAGMAGFMFGLYSTVFYLMGFTPGVKAFAAAVLGGIGNIRGAMIGGLILGEVEVMVGWLTDPKWEDISSFIVLVLILLVRPTGILGERLGRAA
ncbi:branched-chain amino acid ABC transporter permease [uncultured Jatrophihabitans sp.]|uniref:branched-chain amino acid ABC transporter permease n=1 Tax=uncultured Jatrophihabitans sp. TaxID=1610747 RepID=UPI0035CB8B8C